MDTVELSCTSIIEDNKTFTTMRPKLDSNKNLKKMMTKTESSVHPICLRCPITGKPFGIGFSIKSWICTDNRKECPVWGEHEVCDVRTGFIADELGLKNGQKLLTVGKVMTSGMRGIYLQAQFMTLDITDIEIIVQRVKSIDGKISKDAIIISATLEIDPNPDVCALTVQYSEAFEYITPRTVQKPLKLMKRVSITDGNCSMVRVDEIEDLGCSVSCDLQISHPNTSAIVHIEHPKSQQYLKADNGKLVLHPLKKNDQDMVFRGRLLSGYDCTSEPVQVCVFRDTTDKSTSYISAINTEKVGIQDIPNVIEPDVKVLNSDDPRLFYRLPIASNASCFMSTALKDHYLAVTKEEVVLKQVFEEDIQKDGDIHFKLRQHCP